MQECNGCGAKWEIDRLYDVCPFCGASLSDERLKVNSIEDALRMVFEKHGIDVLSNSNLVAVLSDYAPSFTREQKLVRIAVESGAYKALCTASDEEKLSIMNKYVAILSDSYFIDEAWARTVMEWCIKVISPNLYWKYNNNNMLQHDKTVGGENDKQGINPVESKTEHKKPTTLASIFNGLVHNPSTSVQQAFNCTTQSKEKRETIQCKSVGYGEVNRGWNSHAAVRIQFEPINSDRVIIAEQITEGSIPPQFVQIVRETLERCLKAGTLPGSFPVIGVRATIIGGSYMPTKSSNLAFAEATNIAYLDGFSKAKPIIV